jgi:uncharacterized protein YktA (UPF0223 family)
MNDDTKLENLMKDTAEKLKLGKFGDILKTFKQHYNEDDPDFLVIMKTIADAKMVKRDWDGANELYVRVYNVLRQPDKLGPEHTDVLSIMIDCAQTTKSVITAVKLFDEIDEIANRKNETEIIDKSLRSRKEVIDGLSNVNRRIYNRMTSRTERTVVKGKRETHKSKISETEIDELMKTFFLS